MQILIISLAVPLVLVWLISEFKGGKSVRIAFGILAVIGAGLLTHLAAMA